MIRRVGAIVGMSAVFLLLVARRRDPRVRALEVDVARRCGDRRVAAGRSHFPLWPSPDRSPSARKSDRSCEHPAAGPPRCNSTRRSPTLRTRAAPLRARQNSHADRAEGAGRHAPCGPPRPNLRIRSGRTTRCPPRMTPRLHTAGGAAGACALRCAGRAILAAAAVAYPYARTGAVRYASRGASSGGSPPASAASRTRRRTAVCTSHRAAAQGRVHTRDEEARERAGAIFIGFHGFRWIFMMFHGLRWIFMIFHGFPWISMDFHGKRWIFMDF